MTNRRTEEGYRDYNRLCSKGFWDLRRDGRTILSDAGIIGVDPAPRFDPT